MRMYVDGLYVEGVRVYIRVGRVTAVVGFTFSQDFSQRLLLGLRHYLSCAAEEEGPMPGVDARGEPMLPVEDEEKDMSEQAVVRRARAALRGYEEWMASHPLSSSV